MRIVVDVPSINPEEFGEALVAKLAGIHPDGRRPSSGWFGMKLPLDDPRTQAVLRALSDENLEPWIPEGDGTQRKKGHNYSVRYIREYDDSDLASCAYLQLRPRQHILYVLPKTREEAKSYDHEQIALENIDPSFDFITVHDCHAVVPRRVRMLLDSANLTGIHWRPITLWDKREGPNRKLDPDAFSDLSGERILPPMAPSVDLRDARTSKQVSPGYDKPVVLREWLYTPAEPRYRAADLEAFGTFDAARTFEKLWAGDWDRHLIVSQRFYRFCRDHRLKTDFVPVRIEP